MLGEKANHLGFRAIMDEGKVLLLDLGHSDGETNRLIGSLVVTGRNWQCDDERTASCGT